MTRRLRRAVALLLLGLGCLGLLATGSGAWAGSPWPWLVVLALAVITQVAGDHYSARQRLERRTERQLKTIRAAVETQGVTVLSQVAELRQRLDAVGTPEGMKAFRDMVQVMAKDLEKATSVTDRIVNSGGLQSLFKK